MLVAWEKKNSLCILLLLSLSLFLSLSLSLSLLRSRYRYHCRCQYRCRCCCHVVCHYFFLGSHSFFEVLRFDHFLFVCCIYRVIGQNVFHLCLSPFFLFFLFFFSCFFAVRLGLLIAAPCGSLWFPVKRGAPPLVFLLQMLPASKVVMEYADIYPVIRLFLIRNPQSVCRV